MIDPHYNPQLPDHVDQDWVYDFNIYEPLVPGKDVFESMRHLHELGLPEIFWTRHNGGHWVALSAAAISDVLRNPKIFSSKKQWVPVQHNPDSDYFVPMTADPPDHSVYRGIVAPYFAPKRVLQIENDVRVLTNQLIDEVEPRGGCEFVGEIAQQLPVIMFLRFVGLPLEHRPELIRIAHGMVSAPPEGEGRDYSLRQMFNYLRPLLEDRIKAPREDDFLTIVTRAKFRDQTLSFDQMLGLCATILLGGLDSVSTALTFITKFLAEKAGMRRQFAADPASLPAVVDELLRRHPSTILFRRIVEDTEMRSVAMRAGERIVWPTALHSLDDAQFACPMAVQVDRPKTVNATFGMGIHFCIGSPLAKLELRVFLEEWLRRIPEFAIEPGANFEIRTGITIGYHQLPIRWTA